MQIETKYKIGKEVYLVFKEDSEQFVRIYKDKIDEIVIKSDEILYFSQNICEEFSEKEIVAEEDKDLLVERVKELLGSDNDEKNNNE